jgi:hypothetical protein
MSGDVPGSTDELEDYLAEQLRDPVFRAAYEAEVSRCLEAERQRARAARRVLLEIEPHFFDNLTSGKLAVDGHEYQRRLRARRRRSS